MAVPRVKPAVRFRERSDLLDFLLEVATSRPKLSNWTSCSPTSPASSAASSLTIFLPFCCFNEKRKDLRIRYAVGHREEVVRNLSHRAGRRHRRARRPQARQPMLVRRRHRPTRAISRTSDVVRSELSVPMIARQRLVGVIDVQSTPRRRFQGLRPRHAAA